MLFYNTKVKINKIIKIKAKKTITDFCNDNLKRNLNIALPHFGAPARS
tara:strand:- start:500 stop:643 length:144 start_codon:yes stop_codon:yes gene_type:complete